MALKLGYECVSGGVVAAGSAVGRRGEQELACHVKRHVQDLVLVASQCSDTRACKHGQSW